MNHIIVYKEFSSLTDALGFSGKALYSVSNHIQKHYRKSEIPKSDGTLRQLYVPDDFLKSIQKSICDNILCCEAVSRYATAYKSGTSTKANASPHINKPVVLKLDIRHFFDHIIYPLVKDKVFKSYKFSEQNRILLTILCLYKDSLPQGAPSSPMISNIILRDFDETVGEFCNHRGIVYTRYCDDMTFSGDFEPSSVIAFVKTELLKLGFYLNNKKMVVVKQGQRQAVTGIVVNEKLSVPKEYKRKIRQEMYYVTKFGLDSHLMKKGTENDKLGYCRSLLGRINYVLSVERMNKEMVSYKDSLVNIIKGL